jgi:hypothetical protein
VSGKVMLLSKRGGAAERRQISEIWVRQGPSARLGGCEAGCEAEAFAADRSAVPTDAQALWVCEAGIWGAILFAPLAITFGVVGRNEARREGKSGQGLGTAGMVCGIVALFLTVPWAIIVATTA